MKKILIALASFSLVTTTATTVSCGSNTHNRDFEKTNLQIFTASEFSKIGILNPPEKITQEVFEDMVGRAFESDNSELDISKDFIFKYFDDEHKEIDYVDKNILDTVNFQVIATQTSENFESQTEIIKTTLVSDELQPLSKVVKQTFLREFDPVDEITILKQIKRFNNHILTSNLRVIGQVDTENKIIKVNGIEDGRHYKFDEADVIEFTYI
ncbi:hypothetical protein SSABA_v1c07790 [Spiroplasma sabaudiense Ar-1343]|uniref:Lipoprotein n=1 Tax=Spiroplasma sabaudiense Ar-1343 TaxID=1276257 RepID=W6AAZ7_9MOLU|nr:hypothetical protein [Spiroplasma sabaudiense]AHI54181.1 hypothetical protein SSABA_v1c07790 [Spiroplasma sabaudiense Ar-1343]